MAQPAEAVVIVVYRENFTLLSIYHISYVHTKLAGLKAEGLFCLCASLIESRELAK